MGSSNTHSIDACRNTQQRYAPSNCISYNATVSSQSTGKFIHFPSTRFSAFVLESPAEYQRRAKKNKLNLINFSKFPFHFPLLHALEHTDDWRRMDHRTSGSFGLIINQAMRDAQQMMKKNVENEEEETCMYAIW